MPTPFDLTVQHGLLNVSLLFLSAAYGPLAVKKLRACSLSILVSCYKTVAGCTFYIFNGYQAADALSVSTQQIHTISGPCNTMADSCILLLCSYVLVTQNAVNSLRICVFAGVCLCGGTIFICWAAPQFLRDAAQNYTREWEATEPLISACLLYWFALVQLYRTGSLCSASSPNGTFVTTAVYAVLSASMFAERATIYTQSEWILSTHAIRQFCAFCVFFLLPRRQHEVSSTPQQVEFA